MILILSAGAYFLKMDKPEEISKTKYKFGGIVADVQKRLIIFEARINKTSGIALFLIHLSGYNWLREKAAIVSDEKLANLQKAVALIDWRLWDEIYAQNLKSASDRLRIILSQGVVYMDSRELVADNKIYASEILFLGNPVYDSVALSESDSALCNICPIFPAEKKEILSSLKSPDGFQISEKIKIFDPKKPLKVEIYVD